MRRPPVHERGAALITVLAMIMLLAGLASLGLSRVRSAADQLSDQDNRARAGWLASSGAQIGTQMIAQLKARARSQSEILEQPVQLSIGATPVTLQFRDAGNCFNLNSLLPARASPGEAGSHDARSQSGPADLARLMQAVGIAPADAKRLAEATALHLQQTDLDWVDASEWATVPGVDADMLHRLRPLLCALPTREASMINLNSLKPADAPLLVAAGLDIDEARRAIARKPRHGWESGAEFWQQASASGTPATATAQVADTRSRWITLAVRVRLDDLLVERHFLLDTLREPARIVAASWQADQPMNEDLS